MTAPKRLLDIVKPVVRDMGLEFWGLELHSGPGRPLLRVFIEAEVGVSADDCARVSRRLSDVLAVEDPWGARYRLEVSSPGLARPLFEADQYRRYVGSRIQCRLREPMEGRRNFSGRLQSLEDQALLLQTDDKLWRIDLPEVESAKVVPEF